MMGLEVVFCCKCFSFLQDSSDTLADAWADMCSCYVTNDLKPIKWGYECDAIKFLEMCRYLVSQEPEKGKRKLTLKLNGHQIIKGRHFFCIEYDQHQAKE